MALKKGKMLWGHRNCFHGSISCSPAGPLWQFNHQKAFYRLTLVPGNGHQRKYSVLNKHVVFFWNVLKLLTCPLAAKFSQCPWRPSRKSPTFNNPSLMELLVNQRLSQSFSFLLWITYSLLQDIETLLNKSSGRWIPLPQFMNKHFLLILSWT